MLNYFRRFKWLRRITALVSLVGAGFFLRLLGHAWGVLLFLAAVAMVVAMFLQEPKFRGWAERIWADLTAETWVKRKKHRRVVEELHGEEHAHARTHFRLRLAAICQRGRTNLKLSDAQLEELRETRWVSGSIGNAYYGWFPEVQGLLKNNGYPAEAPAYVPNWEFHDEAVTYGAVYDFWMSRLDTLEEFMNTNGLDGSPELYRSVAQ